MEVKKIVEGMTAPEVAKVVDDNFIALDNEKAGKFEMNKRINELYNFVTDSLPYESELEPLTIYQTIEGAYLGSSGQFVIDQYSRSYKIYIYKAETGKRYNISGTYRANWSCAAAFDTEIKTNNGDKIAVVVDKSESSGKTINVDYMPEKDGYLYVVSDFKATEENRIVSLKKELADLNKKVNELSKSEGGGAVVCWGDSLTADSSENAWVSLLRNTLGGKFKVVNCGHGGQTSNQIASRQGGLQPILRLVDPIMLPSYGSYKVIARWDSTNNVWIDNMIKSDNKDDVQLIQGGTYEDLNRRGTGYVEVLGKKYRFALYGEGHTTWKNEGGIGEYTITANLEDSYEEREIRGDVPLAYQSAKELGDCYVQIIFIGANGGYDDVDNLCYQIKRMIERNVNNRYIVLSVHVKRNNSVEIEEMFGKAFGINYLNLRDYFSKYAMEDAVRLGIVSEITEADVSAMNNGTCPPSLLADSIHFNQYGHRLLYGLVLDKGSQLGYW